MTPRLRRACARAVYVITPEGRVLRAGRAAMCVVGLLGWRRTAGMLSRRPFIWAVEIGYRIVADNRSWFGQILFRGEDVGGLSADR